MGKSLPSATRLRELTRIVSSSSERLQKPTKQRPASQLRLPPRHHQPSERLGSARPRLESPEMSSAAQSRQPLSAVVSDCVRRWFHDALKEAKAGDASMQLLVGQMYYSGYGVPKDPHKVIQFLSLSLGLRLSLFYCGVFVVD